MPALRPATAEDRPWLYALHERAHRALVETAYGPWIEEQQQEFFQHTLDDHDVEVVLDEGEPVGAVYLGTVDGDRWIELIEVDPAHQSRGIGSAVLSGLIDTARDEGVSLRLQVHRLNPGARRLYERLGFRLVEENSSHFILRLAHQPD